MLETAADAGGIKDLIDDGPTAQEKAEKEANNFIVTASKPKGKGQPSRGNKSGSDSDSGSSSGSDSNSSGSDSDSD